MSSEEINPQYEALLRQEEVVRARSYEEAVALSASLPTEFRIKDAAFRIQEFVTRWRGRGAGWDQLQGASVLDLGCGSSLHRDNRGRRYHPHFARFAALNGATSYGVDLHPQGDLDKTFFTGVQADIVSEVRGAGLHSLPQLQGVKFDMINASYFVGMNPSVDLRDQLRKLRMSMEFFERLLLSQCIDMLAEGGIVDLMSIRDSKPVYYRKEQGVAEEVSI